MLPSLTQCLERKDGWRERTQEEKDRVVKQEWEKQRQTEGEKNTQGKENKGHGRG